MSTQTTEEWLSLRELSRRCPKNHEGQYPAKDTIKRWIRLGICLKDRKRVKLRAKRFPYGWSVRQSDLDTFLERLTVDYTGPDPESAPA
jgi:hypothetical protein